MPSIQFELVARLLQGIQYIHIGLAHGEEFAKMVELQHLETNRADDGNLPLHDVPVQKVWGRILFVAELVPCCAPRRIGVISQPRSAHSRHGAAR